jgi:hypothetical protein
MYDAGRENAPSLVILSQSAAQHFWPDQDPIGNEWGLRTHLLSA